MHFTNNWEYKYIHTLLCYMSPIKDRRIKMIMVGKTSVNWDTLQGSDSDVS